MKLDPKKKVAAEFSSPDAATLAIVQANHDGIVRLALLTDFHILAEKVSESGGAVRSTALFDLRVPYIAETVDVAAESARLKKEIEGLQKAIASKEAQLGNETFRGRAPEKIIKQMEEALAIQRIELQKLIDRLEQIQKSAA